MDPLTEDIAKNIRYYMVINPHESEESLAHSLAALAVERMDAFSNQEPPISNEDELRMARESVVACLVILNEARSSIKQTAAGTDGDRLLRVVAKVPFNELSRYNVGVQVTVLLEAAQALTECSHGCVHAGTPDAECRRHGMSEFVHAAQNNAEFLRRMALETTKYAIYRGPTDV